MSCLLFLLKRPPGLRSKTGNVGPKTNVGPVRRSRCLQSFEPQVGRVLGLPKTGGDFGAISKTGAMGRTRPACVPCAPHRFIGSLHCDFTTRVT